MANNYLNNADYFVPEFASHNIRSLAFALACAETKKVPPSGIEVQMLYGMAEPFKKALHSKGLRIREYTPVGEMLPGMAYLVRRLLENTSNDGFLKAKFVDDKSTELLLQKPVAPAEAAKLKGETSAAPAVDFNRREVRDTFKKTLDELRANIDRIDAELVLLLNKRADLVLGVKEAKAKGNIEIYSPARERQILDRVTELAKGGAFPKASLEKIFANVISATRSLIGEMNAQQTVADSTCNRHSCCCGSSGGASIYPFLFSRLLAYKQVPKPEDHNDPQYPP